MLGIAIAIGILHVNLGLVLGMINEAEHSLKDAIIDKGSWILLQIGLLLCAASFGLLTGIPLLKYVPGDIVLSAVILGLALSGILVSAGGIGILEILSLCSNILSYARLFVIGLASVYLAVVINEQSIGLFAKGGLWLVLGVAILIIGHAINLALGLFGSFLHSLRLHYVEFFTKFYKGGGTHYEPFGTIKIP